MAAAAELLMKNPKTAVVSMNAKTMIGKLFNWVRYLHDVD